MSETFCAERDAQNAGDSAHCFHPMRDETKMICCWCGDLFFSDVETATHHGPYGNARRRATSRAKGGKTT